MDENKKDGRKLPDFESVEKLVEFFDTHDMGEFDLPAASFDIDLKRRTFYVAVAESLMTKLAQAAHTQQTSTGDLVNDWLEEKLSQAA